MENWIRLSSDFLLLQNAEAVLQELDGYTVNVPELMLLKQYHGDAVSWISRFSNIMVNIHERRDQHNVVDELDCILKDGGSLRVQGVFYGICIVTVILSKQLLEILILVTVFVSI